MLRSIHTQITRQALGELLSPAALTAIVQANLGQDRLAGLLQPQFHFDSNLFERSGAYVAAQRAAAIEALDQRRVKQAWAAFGRLIHAVQDFYSHSNYVALWLAAQDGGTRPAPEAIDPVDPGLMHSPRLQSGKIYYPGELLYFVPGLRKLALSILPADSHAHMNLDSAERGPHFPYAFAAAVKRTALEFEALKAQMSPRAMEIFKGKMDAAQFTVYVLRFPSHRPQITDHELRITYSPFRLMP